MPITINEAGRLVLKDDNCLLLHSRSVGKVYILGKGGETLQWQKISAGNNVIDVSHLQQGSYAIRIENKNNHTLSSFEKQ